jgi:heme oxygenase (biliverdin-IX-beta and delta-forming)
MTAHETKIAFAECDRNLPVYQALLISLIPLFLQMPLTLTSVVECLRADTKEQHVAAEAVLLPRLQLLNSRSQYAQLLRALYGFYAPLEERIVFQLDQYDLPDISQRRNAALILDDLAALDHFDCSIPFCQQLPVIDNKAAAFGALYVLEGSTLGGRVINRMLLNNPSLDLTENELQFFAGYRAATGEMWKRFTAELNLQHDVEAILITARHTFSSLTHWLQISL